MTFGLFLSSDGWFLLLLKAFEKNSLSVRKDIRLIPKRISIRAFNARGRDLRLEELDLLIKILPAITKKDIMNRFPRIDMAEVKDGSRKLV